MNLSDIRPPAGQQKTKRRIGRGMGSRRGKTAGRGMKGARSVTGYSKMRGFEGGQMPLHRRLPKRGFTNIFRKEYAIVNVAVLNELDGAEFDAARLKELGVVKKLKSGLKILGTGELSRAITVKAAIFSESAKKKIEDAGGTAEVIAAFVRAEK
jgi:large subunit ribosomal protein L15